MTQLTKFPVALLALSMFTGCPDAETPSGGTDATIMADAGEDAGAVIYPDAAVVPEDASVGMDAMPVDTGPVPVLRTLPDYRICDDDEDCPVGLGSCVKSLAYNRPLPSGQARVDVSDIFADVAAGRGVCSEACTNDPAACAPLSFNGLTPDPKPHVCQIVSLGPSPYPEQNPPALPFADTLDTDELAAGQPFASICRPPFELDPAVDDGLCSVCQDGQTPCLGSAVCYDLLREQAATDGNSGMCLAPCGTQGCPQGFACTAVAGTDVCMPEAQTCTVCLDLDADGKGAGRCGADANQPVTEVDCDDRNSNAYYDVITPTHAFPAHCGSFDYNCNGLSDDAEQIGTLQFGGDHCTACADACAGPIPNGEASRGCEPGLLDGALNVVPGTCRAVCDAPAERADCNRDVMDGCEIEVTDTSRIYWLDTDNDGYGDPNFATFNCSTSTTPVGYAPSLNGEDCNDDVMNGGAQDNPGAPELCDGRDNNCDTEIDESPFVGEDTECALPGLLGACAVGARTCTNGTPSCDQVVFPSAEICTGGADPALAFDEDCDGVVDNLTALCPNQMGACMGATEQCFITDDSPFTWEAACGGYFRFYNYNSYSQNNSSYSTTEVCDDGIDNNCRDGADCLDPQCSSDPFCNNFCPTIGATRACPNQNGECSGTNQLCQGTNRWSDCDYSSNSTQYATNETGPVFCSDGLDNDCTGDVDCDDAQCVSTSYCLNFCANPGSTRACEEQRGVCSGASQTCGTDNQWPGCSSIEYTAHNSNYTGVETGNVCDGLDNDCDGVVDDGCPVVGYGGFTMGTPYTLNPVNPSTGQPLGTSFGSGSGPTYNLDCPAGHVMTGLYVYHNNDQTYSYNYRSAMRVIGVGFQCGRPQVDRIPSTSSNYIVDTNNTRRRRPTTSRTLSPTVSGNGYPTYPYFISGDYVGIGGIQSSTDDWAVVSVPWDREFEHSSLSCDGNEMIRAFKIKAGGWVDALGASCYEGTINPALPSSQLSLAGVSTENYYGGTGAATTEVDAVCAPDEVMVGLRVQMENTTPIFTSPGWTWVSEMSFKCARLRLNLVANGTPTP